jgi:serine phosphatase RsbU (regulator of sigma subunit)
MKKLTLTYAGAGHPPLLMWSGNSPIVRDVTENGLFLGKFDFATYSSVELPLSAGDRGLLYTDGVSETNNPEGVEFGSERFRQFLAAEENGSANQLVDGLLKDVAQWSARGEGEDLDDDITMVAIHVTDTT